MDLVNKFIEQDLESNINFGNGKIAEATKYSLKNGSRLRPLTVLSLVENTDSAKHFCLFIEYIHTCSIILDDMPCMDDDETRRGNPSLHKKYSKYVPPLVSCNLLLVAMNHLRKGLNCLNYQDDAIKYINEFVTKGLSSQGLCGGQYMDLSVDEDMLKKFPPRKQRSKILEIAAMKTGSLFSISFVLGYILDNNFSKGALDIVSESGTLFGICYQIIDDIRDSDTDKKSGNFVNFTNFYNRNEIIDLFSGNMQMLNDNMNKVKGLTTTKLHQIFNKIMTLFKEVIQKQELKNYIN